MGKEGWEGQPQESCNHSALLLISLAEALLEQAMIGPSPNPLILSYLKYAISSQVKHSCLLLAFGGETVVSLG